MSPFKSTGSISVGKLLSSFRNRDSVGATRLNSSIETDRTPRVSITTTNVDSITPSGGAIYAFWLSSGAFVVDGGSITVDYILIGGGGGSGGYTSSYYGGTTGSNSTALGLTAYGGGGGGSYGAPAGQDGGSGGGGGNSAQGFGLNPSTPAPVIASFPAYTPGTTQGYPGVNAPGTYVGGGGGGAGATGSSLTGGAGVNAFSGDTGIPPSYGEPGPNPGRYFAGGGAGSGGGPGNKGAGSTGGIGGGGNSFPYPSPPATYIASLGGQGMGGGGGSMYSSPYASGGAGGGGAGGYLEGTDFAVTNGPYPIVIGAGGAGSGPTPYSPPRGIGEGGSGIFILRIPAPVVSTNNVTAT